MAKKNLNINIDDGVLLKLDNISKAMGMSRTSVMMMALNNLFMATDITKLVQLAEDEKTKNTQDK